MNLTIASLTFRALLGRRRALVLLPLPVLLLLLSLFVRGQGVAPQDWAPVVLDQLGAAVVLPLTALIVGSSVLGLEIEDGTITHILTKPLPRHEIILAKLLVAWLVTAISTAIPLAICGALAGGGATALGMGIGVTIGALAYSSVFLALSLVTRRPVGVGLVYLIVWENLLVSFVSGAKVLSIREYTMTLAEGFSNSTVLPPAGMPPLVAGILAAVFVVGGAWLATSRLRSFSLAGETS